MASRSAAFCTFFWAVSLIFGSAFAQNPIQVPPVIEANAPKLESASSVAPSQPSKDANVGQSYTLNPGDALYIFAFDEERLNREVVVLPDGSIQYPVIGEVMAAGRTPGELEDVIREGLVEKRFLRQGAMVSVTVTQAVGNTIYVLGQVAEPGSFSTFAQLNVIQALSLAGGLSPFASRGDIRILRTTPEGQLVFKFDYGAVAKGKKLDTNILLLPGDTVIVP